MSPRYRFSSRGGYVFSLSGKPLARRRRRRRNRSSLSIQSKGPITRTTTRTMIVNIQATLSMNCCLLAPLSSSGGEGLGERRPCARLALRNAYLLRGNGLLSLNPSPPQEERETRIVFMVRMLAKKGVAAKHIQRRRGKLLLQQATPIWG